jgi:hypothetical protein
VSLVRFLQLRRGHSSSKGVKIKKEGREMLQWTKFDKVLMGFDRNNNHIASIYQAGKGTMLVRSSDMKLEYFVSENAAKRHADNDWGREVVRI